MHRREVGVHASRAPKLALAGALLAACGGAPARPAPSSAARAPVPPPAAGWSYEVVASPGGEELAVAAVFPAGTHEELTVVEGAEAFLRDVEGDAGAGFARLAMKEQSWFLPSCARGCRIRYRVALAAAARANESVNVARASDGAIEAPPSTWLLRPVRAPLGTPFRFHVTPAKGEAFVSGVFPAAGDAKDTYEGKAASEFQLPYSAIGRVRVHERLNGIVQVAILPGQHLEDEAAVLAWIDTAAHAVEAFYGRFPVPRIAVVVRPVPGDGVGFGTAIGSSGAAVSINVGTAAHAADLKDDWVLVHEMIHTALPDLKGPHHWLEEGLSTYVEPLARNRAGLFATDDLWKDWVKGMPNGQPQAGDRGLDVTHTWGRTYWGGALFCLVADVEIRERTHNAKSLDDALRAVIGHGGNISEVWTIQRVLEVGDAATGVPVLAELYAKTAHAPAPVDLAALWKRLGVVRDGAGSVTFDDTAPLAAVRRAMTPGKAVAGTEHAAR
jgi:hypothetical protein